jgi:hypothetical protein
MNQELLRALEQEAHDPITSGLSGEESVRVERLFANVLRSITEPIYQTPVQHKDAVARRTAENLIRRTASVPSKDRVNYLTKENFNQDAHHLDTQAFAVAKQLLINPNQREALIPQARSILAKVERLKGEIARIWPDQRERYGRILSEAVLDCQYVVSPTDKTSLRLGRLAKAGKRQ